MKIRLLPLLFALTLISLCAQAADDGPTPYPDPKNEAAWPGVGPIRSFGWMVDNRKSFWKLREKDQGAVVFAGDSLTGGWKLDEMLKAFPGLKIANRGVGGDVSRGLLFRFKEDVLDLKPGALADLNARISKIGAGKENLVTLDLFSALATPEGKPQLECFTKDRIHFAKPGYDKWTELLKPAFEKLSVK